MKKTILLNFAVILATNASAPAGTRLVPDEYTTIQAAIDNCNDGDVVIIAPGTHTGDGNRDIDLHGKAITVQSTDPNDPSIVAATIINCDGTIEEPHRGFKFISGEGPDSVVAGLTITRGYAPKEQLWVEIEWRWYSAGGAIFCEGSNPTIENCNIVANSGAPADGIFCVNSSPIINNCSIVGDTVRSVGGGIFLWNSNAVISNCIIADNKHRDYGGAIVMDGSSPKIEHCLIANNSAVGNGGAIYTGESSPIIRHCTFLGNSTAHGEGGAIYCGQGSPTITHCMILDNLAPSGRRRGYSGGRGGGICCGVGGRPKISQCVITENSAGTLGGGIFCNTANITNCTITGNSAVDGGGGFYYTRTTNFTTTLRNCILWNNTAATEPQIGGTSVLGGPVISFNNVQGGFSGEGNIDIAPLFAPDGYHLLANSPCIDAGDPNYIPPAGETDLDNQPRLISRHVDIGADEVDFATTSPIIYFPKVFRFDGLESRANPASQILFIHNINSEKLNWMITESCPWLDVVPKSGTCGTEPNEATLNVDVTGLAKGFYHCQITISDANHENSSQTVFVCLIVHGPKIAVSPSQFEFSASPGQLKPPDQILTIRNSGGGILNWSIDHDCDCLKVGPTSGSSAGEPNEVVLSVPPVAIPPTVSDYCCGLKIYDPSAINNPQVVEVSMSYECFPSWYSTYNDWIQMGKPDCWCTPPHGSGYQCDGDVDGKTETFCGYRIYTHDLYLIVKNWKDKIGGRRRSELDPCADIDHKAETFFKYRVYGNDLATVVSNWKKKDVDLPGDCPRSE